MLGDGARLHAEEDQRAGTGLCRFHLDHHSTRAFGQNLAWPCLAPVPAVGWDWERLGAHHFAPDAACETEAVAAHAPKAGLIVIRRAEPGSRDGYDARGVGQCEGLCHSTPPSWPPSLVA